MSNWLDKQQTLEAEEHTALDDERIEQELQDRATETREEYQYTISTGETIWSVAKKLGVDATELLEHNDLTADYAQPGTVLHLTQPRKIVKDETIVTYVAYDDKKDMHVSFEGGTRKFLFGNVRKWSDLHHAGSHQPQNTNVEIVAEAKVPIGKETALYYMDSHALGKYKDTGMVAYTLGFNHSHLTDGKYEAPIVIPTILEPVMPPAPLTPPEMNILDEPTNLIIEERLLDEMNPDNFKTRYNSLPSPTRYYADVTMMVHDLDQRRPSRAFKEGHWTIIGGTLEKDNKLWGIPYEAKKNGHWLALDMSWMLTEEQQAEKELREDGEFEYGIDYPTRVATGYGSLSPSEQAFALFSKYTAETIHHVSKIKVRLKRK